MTIAIRAGILSQWSDDFGLSNVQLGFINSMVFWGFPVATILGGLAYNSIGPKNLMMIAFFGHLIGLILTVFAGGLTGLLISTFIIGLANGCVEAACNPMISDMYHSNQTTMLNKFHVWFPGGIVIGALASQFMTGSDMTWQTQVAIMLIPTLIYGFLLFAQTFPKS